MGCRNRELFSEEETTSSSSLSEALLLTTMCIIGLPVDVHVKDGSVYSGIFHTACVENEYGIVLKKARMTKKGTSDSNVADGILIETLVIVSADLVQVVAKGVLLSDDGIAGNVAGRDVGAVVDTVSCSDYIECEVKKSSKYFVDKKKINRKWNSVQSKNGFNRDFIPTTFEDSGAKSAGKEHGGTKLSLIHLKKAPEFGNDKRDDIILAKREEASDTSASGRQVGDDVLQGILDEHKEKFELHGEESAQEAQGSALSLDPSLAQVKPVEETHAKQASEMLPDGASPVLVKPDNQSYERSAADNSSTDAVSSSVSMSFSPNTDVTSDSCLGSLATPTEMVPPRSSESSRSAKEFKLNPGAKVFSPSFTNPLPATPALPTAASMGYTPNNSPVVPVAAAQPEVGINPFAPRSSVPVKFIPYSNLTAGNGGSGSQYSEPIVGHMGSRTQPLRYTGQYHPVQTGPAYVHPNSQAVMIGRLGQLVYVHPVSQDLVQDAAAITPVSARPLLTPHQVQFPKHQGSAMGQALQLCVPSPFIANGQQPFAVPSHIPILQPPFPANRPIPVPGSNGIFSTKFP